MKHCSRRLALLLSAILCVCSFCPPWCGRRKALWPPPRQGSLGCRRLYRDEARLSTTARVADAPFGKEAGPRAVPLFVKSERCRPTAGASTAAATPMTTTGRLQGGWGLRIWRTSTA